MGDIGRRRAEQKARTRVRILTVAQELFAARGFGPVTIVEIAATAQVSVQTVFNHFASKEELFFAERAAWVEGPAAAVRDRAPGERPEAALRRHLVGAVEGFARASVDARHRSMVAELDSTPDLLAHERSLHAEAVGRLAGALTDAWASGEDGSPVACRPVLAEVTASVWMAAVRAIVMDLRSYPPAPGDEEAIGERVALTDRVLAVLDSGLSLGEAPAHGAARRVA